MPTVSSQKHAKVLGRHTRLAVTFSYTLAGTPVDLEVDGYSVRVWVTDPNGTTTGPTAAVVSGTTATYQLSSTDLDVDTTTGVVGLVAVAENGTNRLVSDTREITVGSWDGDDTYTPIP